MKVAAGSTLAEHVAVLHRIRLELTSASARLLQHPEASVAHWQHQVLDRLNLQVDEAVRSVQHQGDESKASQIEVGLIIDAHANK